MLSKKTLHQRQKQELHWKDYELGSSLARLSQTLRNYLSGQDIIYIVCIHTRLTLCTIYMNNLNKVDII